MRQTRQTLTQPCMGGREMPSTKLIKYGCESSARLSCSRAMLPCTIFCGCEGGLDCSNEHTKTAVEDIPDAEDDHFLSRLYSLRYDNTCIVDNLSLIYGQ